MTNAVFALKGEKKRDTNVLERIIKKSKGKEN